MAEEICDTGVGSHFFVEDFVLEDLCRGLGRVKFVPDERDFGVADKEGVEVLDRRGQLG